MPEEEKTPNAPLNFTGLPKVTPGEDFSEDYANNFTFEFTPWDFKIIFGQTDQMSGQSNNINWHTSITLPWGVAKILSRVLLLNVVAGEMQLGPIHIPPIVMPPPPMEPTGEMDTPKVRTLYEFHKRLYGSLAGMVMPPEDLDPPSPTDAPKPPA
ncbi:MAG TPA: hypothetical protein VMR62_33435 [Bryobacteraceae bacterium]|jgi:hypothetical protein|nr:hypothetical protein [Bryobacteraceae bacterium]